MSKVLADVSKSAEEGKLIKLIYRKKTTGKVVVRTVGAMEVKKGILYAQDNGKIKKFIPSRVIESKVTSVDFEPSGGYKPKIR